MTEAELIAKCRALGSDATFEGDLKIVLTAAVLSDDAPLTKLREATRQIVMLHEWHDRIGR